MKPGKLLVKKLIWPFLEMQIHNLKPVGIFCSVSWMVIFVGEGRTFKEDKSYPLLKDKWTRGRREGEFLFKN